MTNDETASRLKTFALMLKFGHDLFAAPDYDTAALQAVNDSMALLNFKSAAIFEVQDKVCTVIGQYGQTTVNPNSKQALLQKQLVESIDLQETPLTVSAADGTVPELFNGSNSFFCLKLPMPAAARSSGLSFILLLEYDNGIPNYVSNTAKLLGTSIAEALAFHKFSTRRFWKNRKTVSKVLWWGVILAVLSLLMFVPVPESATADFMLKAPEITAAYAPFEGSVRCCLKQSGERVRKGEVIAEYDTEQLKYRLDMAQAAVREVEAELQLEQQNAFTDQEKLGKVKLLEVRLAALQVSVKEAQWYLDHSRIKSPADGTLLLSDSKAELLTGKSLRIGEKVFEVHGGKGMIAEIAVNEENSSILQKKFSLALFLHTAPEKALAAKTTGISSYPELTEQRVYCYKVSAELAGGDKELRYGMRGVAKLSGAKVFCGYAIAKRIILWFRSL